MRPPIHACAVLLAASLAAQGAAPAPSLAGEPPLLKLRAFAVDMAGAGRARSGTIEITIERWTSDEEQRGLASVLVEKGADSLRDALQKVKPRAGYINSPGGLGWDVHYARQTPLPDGARRIIVATDRPMSFWELRNQPRSADYEFLLLEVRLDTQGEGVGKLAPAAKISYNEVSRTIEIENFGSEPVRLTKVVMVEPKP